VARLPAFRSDHHRTSAGAVSRSHSPRMPRTSGTRSTAIERVWRDFRVHHVVQGRCREHAPVRHGTGCWHSYTGGWLCIRRTPSSTTRPLWSLLRAQLHFDRAYRRSLYKEASAGHRHLRHVLRRRGSVTVYAAASAVEPWGAGVPQGRGLQLTLDHLMASLSIPSCFAPSCWTEQYFRRTGAMRQTPH